MTSFAIDPSKAKASNVANPYDFQGVSVSLLLFSSHSPIIEILIVRRLNHLPHPTSALVPVPLQYQVPPSASAPP